VTTTGDAGFVGWYTPSARRAWRQVCAASTERQCWLELLSARRGDGLFAVLAGGETPDCPPEGGAIWERKRGRHLLPVAAHGEADRASG
jgi:hypothetical protein